MIDGIAMTHMLPDDLNRWPQDPYRLLGVRPDCDARELRRAYLRLIRKFRPDEYPEHFQQIRAVYQYLSMVMDEADPAEEPMPPGVSATGDATIGAERASLGDDRDAGGPKAGEASDAAMPGAGFPSPAGHTKPPAAGALEQAWQRALSGDPESSYAQLVELRNDPESGAPACIRLHWLLVGMPGLDRSRTPADWLVEALLRAGFEGPAFELYLRRLSRHPEEAVRPSADKVLDYPGAVFQRVGLVSARWSAIGKLKRSALIVSDLGNLRGHFMPDHPDAWCYVLALALRHIVWAPRRPALTEACDSIRDELEELSGVYGCFHEELAQLDLLAEVVQSWHSPGCGVNMPSRWFNVVPLGWTAEDPAAVQRAMLPLLREIAGAPHVALDRFERLQECAPSLLHYFGSMILRLPGGPENEPQALDEEDLLKEFQRFLYVHRRSLLSGQKLVLDFCLRETIDPAALLPYGELVGQLIARHLRRVAGAPPIAAGVFCDDGPMQYVYWACRRFWDAA
jgi:hypothetical protein